MYISFYKANKLDDLLSESATMIAKTVESKITTKTKFLLGVVKAL